MLSFQVNRLSSLNQTRQNKSKRVSVHFSRHKKQGKLRNIPHYLLMENLYEDEYNNHGNESDIDETDGN